MTSIGRALTSWRTCSITLLSFSSGLPLGLVLTAIPDWLRSSGVDITTVGLITLAQVPWSFKVIWSPLMERFRPPFFGRRRGWIALAQVALFVLSLALAGVGHIPEAPWVVGALALAIALAAATQDIAYDAYAVEVLHRDEQAVAVGARAALYRVAWVTAGGYMISFAGMWSWPVANLILAALYLPMILVAWKAPEPADPPVAPKSLREAVWLPFLGLLARHRALEILAFVFFYKFADNLAVSLLRPFLIDLGYTADDRGFYLGTIGVIVTLAGTFAGGIMTSTMGLGHSLWLFGALQIISNIGYVVLARSPVDRLLMGTMTGFDTFAQGLGSGAFGVLLLRLTERRFSATQYALFSSLFGLPRIIAGPISGFAVDSLGWEVFFWSTLLMGIPGMALLHRFSPLGVRDPVFTVEAPRQRAPLSRRALVVRGVAGGVSGLSAATFIAALLGALRLMKGTPEAGFNLAGALGRLISPGDLAGAMTGIGLLLLGAVIGLATAAVFAARHGTPDPQP